MVQEKWWNRGQRQAPRSADRIQQDCAGPQADKGYGECSARDWDGKDYLRIIPRVVW
jgi:hypothetical protein